MYRVWYRRRKQTWIPIVFCVCIVVVAAFCVLLRWEGGGPHGVAPPESGFFLHELSPPPPPPHTHTHSLFPSSPHATGAESGDVFAPAVSAASTSHGETPEESRARSLSESYRNHAAVRASAAAASSPLVSSPSRVRPHRPLWLNVRSGGSKPTETDHSSKNTIRRRRGVSEVCKDNIYLVYIHIYIRYYIRFFFLSFGIDAARTVPSTLSVSGLSFYIVRRR